VRDLGVLAARPLTLGMLMTVQRDDGELPADRIDLFERAIAVLARENHERRIEELSSKAYPVEERLRAARRLAAVSVASGRTVIHPRRTAGTPGSVKSGPSGAGCGGAPPGAAPPRPADAAPFR
jgi:hypothetical protein